MTLLDPLVIPYLEFVTNMGQSYSPKSELAFQIYATIGLITISTASTLSAHVVLKMKHLFIFSYAVRTMLLNVPLFLAKYQPLLVQM